MAAHHGFCDFALGESATPLMCAARGGDLEIIRSLIDGADSSTAMANGRTVLDLVSGSERSEPNEEALARRTRLRAD